MGQPYKTGRPLKPQATHNTQQNPDTTNQAQDKPTDTPTDPEQHTFQAPHAEVLYVSMGTAIEAS